jgi:hypothetical protein
MAELKSQCDQYLILFSELIKDVEARTGLDLARDMEEISCRVAHEGISFATKTLPRFYKSILVGIEQGTLQPIPGFVRKGVTRDKGPLPAFLRGLVNGLFYADGLRRHDSDPEWMPHYLGFVAQICTVMYKTEYPYSRADVARCLRKFRETDASLNENIPRFIAGSIADLTIINAMEFLQILFKGFTLDGVEPHHGGGAVAGGEVGYEKYNYSYFACIDDVFPYEEYFIPHTHRDVDGVLTYGDSRELEYLMSAIVAEDPENKRARICLVNKDSRGPRIISCEPASLMWPQQLVGTALRRYFEQHHLTRGHLNFADQTVNQRLAFESSVTGKLATLDMEDASDRLSDALVRLLLPSRVYRVLNACRSEETVLPDGQVVRMRKFAPMGSACCFPVESVIFYALCAGFMAAKGSKTFKQATRDVYVYGDDILFPSELAESLIATLECYDLRFNRGKCYLKGPFRESCGCDAIAGEVITPVKLRRTFPNSSRDVSSIVSTVSTSNLLYKAGYWRAAAYLQRIVEDCVGKPLDLVPESSGMLGLFSYANHGYRVMADIGPRKRDRKCAGTALKWKRAYGSVAYRGKRVDQKVEEHEPLSLSSILASIAREEKEQVPGLIAPEPRGKPHSFPIPGRIALKYAEVTVS